MSQRRVRGGDASVLVTPAANYLAVAERWVEALLDAYAGRLDVVESLEMAATDIDGIVAAGDAAA